MGKIKIMLDSVRTTNQSISTSVPVLNQVKSGIMSTKSGLYSPVLRRYGISGSFNSVISMLSDIIAKTNNLTKAIDMYVSLYEKNERELTDTEVKIFLSLLPSMGNELTINTNAFLDDISPSEKSKIIDKIIGSSNIRRHDFIGRYGMQSIPLWAVLGGGASEGGGGGSWGPTYNFKEYKESTAFMQLHTGNATWRLLGEDLFKSRRESGIVNYLLKYSNKNSGDTLYVGKITDKNEDNLKTGYEFKDFNENLKEKLKKKESFQRRET